MSVEKKLRKGEQRYMVKEKAKRLFGIYDKARASYPNQLPEIGKVKQDFTDQAEATVEADRLNKKLGIAGKSSSLPKKQKKTRVSPDETVQVEESPEIEELPDLPDLPDYGELDAATAEKYVEGIL